MNWFLTCFLYALEFISLLSHFKKYGQNKTTEKVLKTVKKLN